MFNEHFTFQEKPAWRPPSEPSPWVASENETVVARTSPKLRYVDLRPSEIVPLVAVKSRSYFRVSLWKLAFLPQRICPQPDSAGVSSPHLSSSGMVSHCWPSVAPKSSLTHVLVRLRFVRFSSAQLLLDANYWRVSRPTIKITTSMGGVQRHLQRRNIAVSAPSPLATAAASHSPMQR